MKEDSNNIDWIAKAIEYEATPRALRIPKKKGEFISSLKDIQGNPIPSSTYYYELSKKENSDKIIDISFRYAKRLTPEVLEKLGEKAVSGNDTSIAQFMEYVLEIKKRLDITTDGDKINPMSYEQALNIIGRKEESNRNNMSE